jgi:hypothetical protein
MSEPRSPNPPSATPSRPPDAPLPDPSPDLPADAPPVFCAECGCQNPPWTATCWLCLRSLKPGSAGRSARTNGGVVVLGVYIVVVLLALAMSPGIGILLALVGLPVVIRIKTAGETVKTVSYRPNVPPAPGTAAADLALLAQQAERPATPTGPAHDPLLYGRAGIPAADLIPGRVRYAPAAEPAGCLTALGTAFGALAVLIAAGVAFAITCIGIGCLGFAAGAEFWAVALGVMAGIAASIAVLIAGLRALAGPSHGHRRS